MSQDTQSEIESWIAKYKDMPDAQVRAAMSGWKQHAAGWIAGDLVLSERARLNDPSKPLLEAVNAHLTTIGGRIAAIEARREMPFYKSWAFWISILAFVVSLLALFRDLLDLRIEP